MSYAEIFKNYMLETSDVAGSLPPIPTVDNKNSLDIYCREHHIADEAKASLSNISVHPDWLPYAAEVYEISSDIKDYMTVPVIIMSSDLPNRNLTAFPATELSAFSPQIGDLVYRGWKGKPVCVDHINQQPNKAIGAIVDVSMKKMSTSTDVALYKVVALLAIDTTKGSIPKDIISGRRTHYSMGAYVRSYSCSICGQKGQMKSTMKSKFDCLPCGKQHVGVDRSGNMRMWPTDDGKSHMLGFLNAHDVVPFEVSSVPTPAFVSATAPTDSITFF
jgi:hypothetical protein